MIELLVVISIIAMLIAILLPVLGKARESGRDVMCKNKQRQIGYALFTYANTFKDQLIPGSVLDASSWPYVLWYNVLDNYMGGLESYGTSHNYNGWTAYDMFSGNARPDWQECPSQDYQNTTYDSVGYGWNHYGDGEFHPGFGGQALDANHGGSGWGWNSRLAEVTKPYHTAITGDSLDLDVMNFYPAPATQYYWYSRQLFSRSTDLPLHRSARHSGNGNYLFLDGHVSPMAREMDLTVFWKIQN